MNRQTRQDTLAVGHVGGRVAVRAKIGARTERTESKVRWLLRGVGVGGGWWAWVHAMVFGAWRAGEQTASVLNTILTKARLLSTHKVM